MTHHPRDVLGRYGGAVMLIEHKLGLILDDVMRQHAGHSKAAVKFLTFHSSPNIKGGTEQS